MLRRNGNRQLRNLSGRCVFHDGQQCTIYNHFQIMGMLSAAALGRVRLRGREREVTAEQKGLEAWTGMIIEKGDENLLLNFVDHGILYAARPILRERTAPDTRLTAVHCAVLDLRSTSRCPVTLLVHQFPCASVPNERAVGLARDSIGCSCANTSAYSSSEDNTRRYLGQTILCQLWILITISHVNSYGGQNETLSGECA